AVSERTASTTCSSAEPSGRYHEYNGSLFALRLGLSVGLFENLLQALRRRRLFLKTERHQVLADVRHDRHAVGIKQGHALGAILQLWYFLTRPDDTLVGFVQQVEISAHKLDQDLLRCREMI